MDFTRDGAMFAALGGSWVWTADAYENGVASLGVGVMVVLLLAITTSFDVRASPVV